MSTPPSGRKIIAPKSKLNNPRALPTFTGAPGPSGYTTQFNFNSPGSSPPAAALNSYGGTNGGGFFFVVVVVEIVVEVMHDVVGDVGGFFVLIY